MNYENRNEQKQHLIKIDNREKIEISGVKKIESLNNSEFIINTILGMLTIKGENLEMERLDIDKGNLWINGKINSLSYDVKEKTKEKKQSFLGKVFK